MSYRPRVADPEALFWSKVQKSEGCWEWTGPLAGRYGVFAYHNKHVRAPRYSWELANGPIPGGLHVLHHCDNPPCVRPDHLHLGTHADNMREMFERGLRVAREGCNNSWKLTADDVREIRRLYDSGEANSTQLGARFRVAPRYVLQIVKRKSWSYVE